VSGAADAHLARLKNSNIMIKKIFKGEKVFKISPIPNKKQAHAFITYAGVYKFNIF